MIPFLLMVSFTGVSPFSSAFLLLRIGYLLPQILSKSSIPSTRLVAFLLEVECFDVILQTSQSGFFG